MALKEPELIHAILWMLFILLLFVILHVVQQLDQVGNSRQETRNPVEHQHVYTGLSVPYEETQEPGIHPSMAWKNQIEVLRNRLQAMQPPPLMDGRGVRNRARRDILPCEETQETRDAMENEEKKMKAVDQENPMHTANSSDAVCNKTELNKDEYANGPENEEHPGCVPDEPQNEVSDSDNTVSDTLTPSGAMAVEAASEEQPSASGFTAIAHATSPNPNKKKGGKKNKKRKKKEKALTDERKDKEMPVSDPEASTDESHHSSIETFNSGFETEEMKSDQQSHPSYPMESMAGVAKEKRFYK